MITILWEDSAKKRFRTAPIHGTDETISYDKIGNPLTYLGATLTWNGRQLTSYTTDNKTITYTYDANGLRASKTVNGVTSKYFYVNGQLHYEERSDGTKLYYFYDSNGYLSGINHNGTNYYPATNLKGDVVAIYRHTGALWATYEYDAWGNVIAVKDASGNAITDETNIALVNPIRYRGYYYDSETELYYLQSRYYNAEIGRFLNEDGYLTTGQGVLSYNMFAYCMNNPVMYSDPSGCVSLLALAITVISTVALAFLSCVVNRVVKYATLGREQDPITGKEIVENIVTDKSDILDTACSVKSGCDGLADSKTRKETHGKNLANAAWALNNNVPFYAESIDTGYFKNDYEYSQYCLSLANQTNSFTNGLSWDALCDEGKAQDFIGVVPYIDKNYHNIVRRDGLELLIDMFT